MKKVLTTDADEEEQLEAMSVDHGWLMESVPIVSATSRFAMLRLNLAKFPSQVGSSEKN